MVAGFGFGELGLGVGVEEEEGGWDRDSESECSELEIGPGARYVNAPGALLPIANPLPRSCCVEPISESTLTELLRLPEIPGPGGRVGGGSYPGCLTPNNQMLSVHLSGTVSLSNKYLTALSRCRPPVRAAVSSALGRNPTALVGDDDCCCCCCWASKDGKDRSVEDDENV